MKTNKVWALAVVALILVVAISNISNVPQTRVVHTGESITFLCADGKSYFVELFQTSPSQVAVMQGTKDKIDW